MRNRFGFSWILVLVAYCFSGGQLEANPGASWALDEGAGSNIMDSRSCHGGQLVNAPEWVEGVSGTALQFNGVDQYVVLDNPDEYIFNHDFTWSAWIKTDGPGLNGAIIAKSPSTWPHEYGNNPNWELGAKGLFVNADGVLNYAPGSGPGVLSRTRVDDGEWHHVAVTVQYAWEEESGGEVTVSDIARLYIDGGLDETDRDLVRARRRHASGEFKIGFATEGPGARGQVGNPGDSSGSYFRGAIDDVRIFNGALSDAEVNMLFLRETPECGDDDTQALALVLEPAPDGKVGHYSVRATGADDSGDVIWCTFFAHRQEGLLDSLSPDMRGIPTVIGPLQSNTATFWLPEGTWTISMNATDNLLCDQEAMLQREGEHVRSTEPFVVEALEASETIRVSNFGNGVQLWYEFENWTERSPDTDEHYMVVESDGAFGKVVTRRGVDPRKPEAGDRGGPGGRLRWDFDISAAGGEAGTWTYWVRSVNPQNLSDYLLVEGDSGDANLPTSPDADGLWPGGDDPIFSTSDDRVHESDVGPYFFWSNTYRSRPVGEGNRKQLQDGENTAYFFHRQGQNLAFLDVVCWADDPNYLPSDEDYKLSRPVSEVTFRRGDTDGDGDMELDDIVSALTFLFLGTEAPPCMDAADVDDDGAVRLTDAVVNASYQFLGGGQPPPPFTTCGPDPTADNMMCLSYAGCE